MIHPSTRMVIYGAIWYQSESNSAYNQDKYPCTFSKMIEYWRQVWNQRTNGNTDIQFSFGFVQLSAIVNNGTEHEKFPMLRWHQTFDVGYMPNKVVPKSIAVAYNQSIEFQGPIVFNAAYSTGGETLNITYTAVTDFELRNSNGFEVCCEGSQCSNNSLWFSSIISNKDGLTITLKVPNTCIGKQLYGLRYLCYDRPCPFKQAAIYSSTDSDLPSPPYIKIF